MGADRPPTAEGALERKPLAHLLVYALDRRLTGAMFLTEPSGLEHVFRLVNGAPVKIRPGDRFALLGEMLVEAGAVSASTIDDAVATKGLLGDVLLLAGCVDRDELERVAEEQFIRRMVRLFSLPKETSYRYYDGHFELVDHGGNPASTDPLALLWAGLRAHGDASTMLESTLTLVRDGAMRIHPQATTGRLGLNEAEQRVIDELSRGPTSMRKLAAAGIVSDEVLRRLCYALIITRQLDLGTGSLPLGAVARSKSSGGNAVVAKMQLKAAAHRVGAAAPDPPGDGERNTSSGLRLIDVRTLPPEVARSASELGPLATPLRPPPAEDPRATLKSASEPPLGVATPSQGIPVVPRRPSPPPDLEISVLSEEEEEALRSVDGGAEVRPAMSVRARGRSSQVPAAAAQVTVLSAPALFRRASSRFAEGDLEDALEACAMARKAAPGEPDYIALSVWIRFQRGGADLKALAIELDEVLAAHESHVEGRFYRAILRRRLSDDPGAIRDLRRVLELAPAHEEAARELAGLEARRPKERGGILGRLFKR